MFETVNKTAGFTALQTGKAEIEKVLVRKGSNEHSNLSFNLPKVSFIIIEIKTDDTYNYQIDCSVTVTKKSEN